MKNYPIRVILQNTYNQSYLLSHCKLDTLFNINIAFTQKPNIQNSTIHQLIDNSCNINLHANNTPNIQVIYYNNSLYSQINQNVICKSHFAYDIQKEAYTRIISYLNNVFNYVENYTCLGHVDKYSKYDL